MHCTPKGMQTHIYNAIISNLKFTHNSFNLIVNNISLNFKTLKLIHKLLKVF